MAERRGQYPQGEAGEAASVTAVREYAHEEPVDVTGSFVLHEPPWYGTVCPVVWEDGGSNPASYPMCATEKGSRKRGQQKKGTVTLENPSHLSETQGAPTSSARQSAGAVYLLLRRPGSNSHYGDSQALLALTVAETSRIRGENEPQYRFLCLVGARNGRDNPGSIRSCCQNENCCWTTLRFDFLSALE